jgi:hypothetical protein
MVKIFFDVMMSNLLVKYQTMKVRYRTISFCGHEREVFGDDGLVTLLDRDKFGKDKFEKVVNA